MMQICRFERTFGSEIFKVKPVLSEAMQFIHNNLANISSTDEYDLRLIFSELLFNAVIHGNKMDKTKSVTLCIEIDGSLVSAAICDQGAGFDYFNLINSFNSEDGLLSEHGRGVRLAYFLTDDMNFNVSGNEIKIIKKVESDG